MSSEPKHVEYKHSKVDVLVIGAGPAGLMASNALAYAGVNFRVIDKRPNKVAAGQADGIQPRTIEVLQSYGIAEPLIRDGNQMHWAAFYNPAAHGGIERTGRVPDVTAQNPRFPFEITLNQGSIESLFLDSMAKIGVTVDRPIEPVSMEISSDEKELADPTSYPITVKLTTNEIVKARFLIGADGAHSWVRKNLNINLEGEQTDYVWGVVDMAAPDTDFPDIRNRCVIHSNNGSCMIIPREFDKVRLYLQLNSKDVVVNGRVDRTLCSPEILMGVAQKSLHPYQIKFGKVEWDAVYLIGQRVAAAFTKHERVFIAGDACHTHSPKAGQGMNASMNDTHNLVWKIAHVVRGWAQPSLLNTYEFERRYYAQQLIDFDKKFARLFSGKPRTEGNEDGVSHDEFLQAFQTFGGFTSGIGIHYRDSIIVDPKHQQVASLLTVGKRFPPQIVLRAADARPYELQDLIPSDTRFKVIVFTGNSNDPERRTQINALADEMCGPKGLLSEFTPAGGKWQDAFDVLTIHKVKKENINHNDTPLAFRSHWSKVLVDDLEIAGLRGGKAYETYGISEEAGAIVVVRPDGYVGTVAPLNEPQHLSKYFAAFWNTST